MNVCQRIYVYVCIYIYIYIYIFVYYSVIFDTLLWSDEGVMMFFVIRICEVPAQRKVELTTVPTIMKEILSTDQEISLLGM